MYIFFNCVSFVHSSIYSNCFILVRVDVSPGIWEAGIHPDYHRASCVLRFIYSFEPRVSLEWPPASLCFKGWMKICKNEKLDLGISSTQIAVIISIVLI